MSQCVLLSPSVLYNVDNMMIKIVPVKGMLYDNFSGLLAEYVQYTSPIVMYELGLR